VFDLHPEYPPEGIPREWLERRYGSHFADSVRGMIEEAGLPVSTEIDRVPSSRKSLLLAELARDEGKLDDFKRLAFAAYWADGRDIGDDELLTAIAREAGLPEDEVRAELMQEQRLDRVLASTAEATGVGVTGVPAWVIDERVLVPGAQPHDVFEGVLEKLGHAPLEREGDR
jgi:predicted DsbA family dithiol-disulfide isomerase